VSRPPRARSIRCSLESQVMIVRTLRVVFVSVMYPISVASDQSTASCICEVFPEHTCRDYEGRHEEHLLEHPIAMIEEGDLGQQVVLHVSWLWFVVGSRRIQVGRHVERS